MQLDKITKWHEIQGLLYDVAFFGISYKHE